MRRGSSVVSVIALGCVIACYPGTGSWSVDVPLATPDGGTSSSTPDGGTSSSTPPTWSTELATSEGLWIQRKQTTGMITFGVTDSRTADNAAVALLFPGDPSLTSASRVGPADATELASQRMFQYGTFRARLQLASCASGEEVVNGFFTYFNDGTDLNGNGLADNSEIDIEILCGTPQIISLTSWVDYDGATGRFVKWSRSIDTSTGQYSESIADNVYDQELKGSSPEFKIPGFPDPNAYYEMGFEWHAQQLRFFLVASSGKEITLWDFRDTQHIPQRSGQLMFNVWHADTHWFSPGGAADYPAVDATLRIDWARYWSE